jgi:hypothetical protein
MNIRTSVRYGTVLISFCRFTALHTVIRAKSRFCPSRKRSKQKFFVFLILAPSFSDADCEEGDGPAEPEDIDTLIRSQFRERGGGGAAPVSRRAGTARSLTSLTMGVGQSCINSIREGRAASKSPHLAIFFLLPGKKFLPISFKIQNFSQKTEGTKTKADRCRFFMMSFPFLYVLNHLQSSLRNCLHFAKFVCLLKRLQRLKQEWQKSPAGSRQTYCKN